MGILPSPPVLRSRTDESVQPKSYDTYAARYSDYEIAMWLLKRNESLRLEAYWDVSQWTIGWGTKSHEGEVITKEEADKRVRIKFQQVYDKVHAAYPKLDRLTALVIAEFKYNVGTIGNGLDSALKANNKRRICNFILQYVNAGGEKLPGLVSRRKREVAVLNATPIERDRLADLYKTKVESSIRKNS
jgi:GH24 family phage-related lysozyme (muramidase)